MQKRHCVWRVQGQVGGVSHVVIWGGKVFSSGRRGKVVNVHKFQKKEFVFYPIREVIYTKLYF